MFWFLHFCRMADFNEHCSTMIIKVFAKNFSFLLYIDENCTLQKNFQAENLKKTFYSRGDDF